jgi:hypothetical protein
MGRSIFYRTQDDVLARARDGGMHTPEVFHPNARRWVSYPDLDTLTDARPIPASVALAHARADAGDDSISMRDLEKPRSC